MRKVSRSILKRINLVTRGKAIMGPVGGAVERVALAAIGSAGVKADEIRPGFLDNSQQFALVGKALATGERWTRFTVDAVVSSYCWPRALT